MIEHNVGTREDWQAARDKLAQLEAEHAKLTEKVLGQVEGEQILNYVLTSFAGQATRSPTLRHIPEANPVAFGEASVKHGETIFLQRCTGCHGRKADGKGPNSLDILPRPRNLRNSWFVTSTPDRRFFDSILYGVQGTAIPAWIDYGLNQQDVGDIVNFIRGLNPHGRS